MATRSAEAKTKTPTRTIIELDELASIYEKADLIRPADWFSRLELLTREKEDEA